MGVRDQVMDLVASQGMKVSRTELMPTPNTMDYLPPRSAQKIAESKNRTPGGYANVRETVVNDLLPTPTAVDGNTVAQSELDADDPKHRLKVAAQVLARDSLLPTVIASEGTKQDTTVTIQERIDTGHQVHLTHIARSGVDNPTVWGKFAPAIARWEAILGRLAPAPTKPDGKDGAHRLSSAFTEWMMGLPEGWITDCGLSRNEELKACGNGVVPAQARLALSILLDGMSQERERERERMTMFPTPTVSDTFTDNLGSTQQKAGSMHSVTLPQAVRMIDESD